MVFPSSSLSLVLGMARIVRSRSVAVVQQFITGPAAYAMSGRSDNPLFVEDVAEVHRSCARVVRADALVALRSGALKIRKGAAMFFSKIIVKWLEWIIEIGIGLTLIAAFFAGWNYGSGFFGGLIAAILATVVAGIFCALVFGAFIVLMEIRKSVQNIESSRKVDP